MPGRPQKTKAQIAYELNLRDRITALRQQTVPGDAVVENRTKFADMLGVSASAYEKWEQRGAVSAHGIYLLCQKTGVDPHILLDIPYSDNSPSAASIQLAQSIESLNATQKAALTGIVNSYKDLGENNINKEIKAKRHVKRSKKTKPA